VALSWSKFYVLRTSSIVSGSPEVTQQTVQMFVYYAALYLYGGKSGWIHSLVPRYLFTTKVRFKLYFPSPPRPNQYRCDNIHVILLIVRILFLLVTYLEYTFIAFVYLRIGHYPLFHPRFDSYQVLLVGGSITYPIVASATTWPPQGHYISDSGDSRTHGSLQRCHRWFNNPRGITLLAAVFY